MVYTSKQCYLNSIFISKKAKWSYIALLWTLWLSVMLERERKKRRKRRRKSWKQWEFFFRHSFVVIIPHKSSYLDWNYMSRFFFVSNSVWKHYFWLCLKAFFSLLSNSGYMIMHIEPIVVKTLSLTRETIDLVSLFVFFIILMPLFSKLLFKSFLMRLRCKLVEEYFSFENKHKYLWRRFLLVIYSHAALFYLRSECRICWFLLLYWNPLRFLTGKPTKQH